LLTSLLTSLAGHKLRPQLTSCPALTQWSTPPVITTFIPDAVQKPPSPVLAPCFVKAVEAASGTLDGHSVPPQIFSTGSEDRTLPLQPTSCPPSNQWSTPPIITTFVPAAVQEPSKEKEVVQGEGNGPSETQKCHKEEGAVNAACDIVKLEPQERLEPAIKMTSSSVREWHIASKSKTAVHDTVQERPPTVQVVHARDKVTSAQRKRGPTKQQVFDAHGVHLGVVVEYSNDMKADIGHSRVWKRPKPSHSLHPEKASSDSTASVPCTEQPSQSTVACNLNPMLPSVESPGAFSNSKHSCDSKSRFAQSSGAFFNPKPKPDMEPKFPLSNRSLGLGMATEKETAWVKMATGRTAKRSLSAV